MSICLATLISVHLFLSTPLLTPFYCLPSYSTSVHYTVSSMSLHSSVHSHPSLTLRFLFCPLISLCFLSVHRCVWTATFPPILLFSFLLFLSSKTCLLTPSLIIGLQTKTLTSRLFSEAFDWSISRQTDRITPDELTLDDSSSADLNMVPDGECLCAEEQRSACEQRDLYFHWRWT